jgi:hypothetical protein
MRRTLTILSVLLCGTLHGQSTYSTGFEPPDFVVGPVSNTSPQDGWSHISNSPTGGRIVAAPVHSGAQSLELFLRESDFIGVANHLFSRPLTDPAGETGSNVEGVVVADPENIFTASFWFRTPAAPLISSRSDGRIAELNPSSKGPDLDDPANRYAQVRVFNNTNTLAGLVRIEIFWYTGPVSSSNAIDVAADNLAWGQWYRLDYTIELVDGLAPGGGPNDRFSLSVFDAGGTLLGTACGSTWEMGYKTPFPGYPAPAGPRAINGFDFWAQTTPEGVVVGHIDDLTMSTFTAPVAPLAVTVEGTANVCSGGTTTLTANVTGDNGGLVTYAWVDEDSNVVGTDPTLVAGGGTYTLTVTEVCETATSAPFVVTEYPPLAVSINGELRLIANPSGGTGVYTSCVWRNEANAIVATRPVCDPPAPGTYTVNVTDSACGTATAQVTVGERAVETIPTASEWGLFALAAMLGAVAMVRVGRS